MKKEIAIRVPSCLDPAQNPARAGARWGPCPPPPSLKERKKKIVRNEGWDSAVLLPHPSFAFTPPPPAHRILSFFGVPVCQGSGS